jgi:type IV pilus assembly protein PilX
MALTSALLLLLVTTMLGVAMFRGFGFAENIAGNTREKERALHQSTSTQYYLEWWLTSSGGINATTGTTCPAGSITVQVCSNVISSPWTIPWTTYTSYTVPGMTYGSPGTVDNYASQPQGYISFLASSYNGTTGTQTSSYQIDTLGYGGSMNSSAVAESTYNVSVTYTATNSKNKFINLGGP